MKSKKGISLIVLVITIIVMIVLAGAIILSLNNSGIIGKANQAVSSTDEATVKELAQMAWAEAYADGVRKVETEGNVKGFQDRVTEALEANKIDTTKYLLNVTEKGVTVKLLAKAWVQEGFIVVKGNQVLEIGDIVNYNAGVEGYTGGWKVMGADANGNLLVMSAANVKSNHRLGYGTTDTTTETKLEEAQNDWLNGTTELDGICAAYGKGAGAIGARSITVEDVNAVTKYIPETEQYGIGNIYQYGNTVTYKYNLTADETKPVYTSVAASGTLSNAHARGFYYYDGKEFKHITDLAIGERGKAFATLTSNYYSYEAQDLTTINKETNAKAFEMIFGQEEYDEELEKYTYTSCYWLASPYVYTHVGNANFGMRSVDRSSVSSGYLFNSTGSSGYSVNGVRAVVILSSDIQLTGSSVMGWSY